MQIVFYDNIFLQKYNMTFQANCLILEIFFMKFQSLLFGNNKKKKTTTYYQFVGRWNLYQAY